MGRILLLRLTKDIDGPSRLVGDVGNVEPARLLLANLLDLLEVLFRELDLLEVLLDARCSDGLGDDAVSANLCPCENDLCGCGAVSLGDGLDGVVLDEQGNVEHVVAECLYVLAYECGLVVKLATYGVLGDVNVLLLAVCDKFWLEQSWVALDLVGSGCDAGTIDQGLKVLFGVVGNADSARLLLG
jgi:hypothetical protein